MSEVVLMMKAKYSILGIAVLLAMATVDGQFYNGHQMVFGKNRVQYNNFYWQYYRFDKFDTYFNEYGVQLAQYTGEYAAKEITRIENLFDYNLDKRIIFLVYNKLSDFRQSNIGLITGSDDYNIGGVTQVSKNKVFLYFEGDFQKFEEQIKAGITRVIINEMIFGIGFRDNITNSTLINLPEWYIEGLISYVSKGWDFETENRVKDGLLSKKYKKFNRLVGEEARIAGHSFWRYIAEVYGESVIPSILYLTKINKNANTGFLYVLGAPLKELSKNWQQYYKTKYETGSNELPDNPLLKRPHKKRVYQQIKISPTGNYIAYVTNQMGQFKIWLFNTETRKHKKILKKEHKLEQITDYSQPVLAWHPSGRILTFITEEEGGLKIYYYTIADKSFTIRNVLYFDKVLDYAFSHDGAYLAISAVKDGKSDIYIHNIAAASNIQITDDLADDSHPRFINNSTQLIFSSNRESDTLSEKNDVKDPEVNLTDDLFIYDIQKNSNSLIRLSDEKYQNEEMPSETGNHQFILLSDKNGTINRYTSKFDSTISHVDTTVHYRYLANTSPLTNYSRNILDQDYNKKADLIGEVIFYNGRYYMYSSALENDVLPEDEISVSEYRVKKTNELVKQDSLDKIEVEYIHIDSVQNNILITPLEDTITLNQFEIDINNYVFEIEKLNYYNSQLEDKNIVITMDNEEEEEEKIRIYQKAFYQNYIVSQIDFSFLNASYQAFTGGAVYFNPGMNALIKVGTNDLFEDYKITGGMRLPLDFESTEYLISIENLKQRLDKQMIFHRQAFKNVIDETTYIKTYSHELSLVMRYPFSQVASWVRTLNIRHDKTVYLTNTINPASALDEPNTYKVWAGIKLEYIFDNTRKLGINLPVGTRYKIFGELYQQVNGKFDNLIVLGADFRNYTVLHRNLIMANRFAASTSFGSSRLIYYLGGVDNWTNFTPFKTPTFIPLSEIRIDETANYVYQAVATNMRGFSQNIRNGSSFALINNEVRWPIISYFANYPLSSSFFENLQLIGFFDFGTAWSGASPWSGKNAYDTDVIVRGQSLEVTIDADRSPFVAGYGFGVRSQLLGYFIRLDWAWGIENMQVLPHIFYFSLSLDF